MASEENSEYNKQEAKIIIIGDSGVGKTSLTMRYLQNKFIENTQATIGWDNFERTIDIGTSPV